MSTLRIERMFYLVSLLEFHKIMYLCSTNLLKIIPSVMKKMSLSQISYFVIASEFTSEAILR
jgi:hypothetical protein